jgi:anthranilate synthase
VNHQCRSLAQRFVVNLILRHDISILLRSIFNGLPDSFQVARYHSLYGLSDKIPSCLDVTALTEDGIVMGIQHKTLPFAAVQFHPESILTSPSHGMTILTNALSFLSKKESAEKEVNGN